MNFFEKRRAARAEEKLLAANQLRAARDAAWLAAKEDLIDETHAMASKFCPQAGKPCILWQCVHFKPGYIGEGYMDKNEAWVKSPSCRLWK